MPSNVEHYKGLKPAGKGLYKCNNLGPKALGYSGQPPKQKFPCQPGMGSLHKRSHMIENLHCRKPHSNGYYKFGKLQLSIQTTWLFSLVVTAMRHYHYGVLPVTSSSTEAFIKLSVLKVKFSHAMPPLYIMLLCESCSSCASYCWN